MGGHFILFACIISPVCCRNDWSCKVLAQSLSATGLSGLGPGQMMLELASEEPLNFKLVSLRVTLDKIQSPPFLINHPWMAQLLSCVPAGWMPRVAFLGLGVNVVQWYPNSWHDYLKSSKLARTDSVSLPFTVPLST